MTPKDVQRLVRAARGAMQNAVALGSGIKVGAALLTKGGGVYAGANVENPSLMLTVCAERSALLNALSSGEKADDFYAMAVVSSRDGYCYPCGACRQELFEFSPDLPVYLSSGEGIKKYSVRELLPHPWLVPNK